MLFKAEQSVVTSVSVDRLSEMVDDEIHRVLDRRELPLYKMMTYHLGWDGGKAGGEGQFHERVHGISCLLAAEAAGGEIEQALPAAAAVELVSNFTEIHDDIQGGRPTRDERDSVWWVWGPAQAINAGDGMHALARLAMFRLQEKGASPATTFRALQLLDEASLDLCEGRFQDLDAQERLDFSVDDYMAMAARKSGALMACAMRLGGLVASADDNVMDVLGLVGEKLGVAMQVLDDLDQLWGAGDSDGRIGDEVLNKKKLLPIAYAFQEGTAGEKRRLGEVYFKRVLDPADVAGVREAVEKLGAKSFCEDLVGQYTADAIAALDSAGLSSEGAGSLQGMVCSRLRL